MKNNNNKLDPSQLRGHSLRKARYSCRDGIYLLTSVTRDRELIFSDWRLGRCVAAAFCRAEAKGLARTLAWVVMPDHFHWLVALEEADLTTLMRRVKGSSALAINRARGANGRIWQPGFHDHAVRKEEDVRALARYVVANPLRAGLVDTIGDYPLWDAIWL